MYLVLSVHTVAGRDGCGIIRHGTATEGLSHALQPAHGTILAYLDSYPSETSPPNRCWRCCRRIHTAEICTPLRLRLLLAERVEAHALCILAHAPACISPSSFVFPYPPASRLQKGRDQTTKWNFANPIARLGFSSPAARSCQPSCASRLHFTTLQPITVSSTAMHKLAIHPSSRVRQSCASRA